MQAIEAVTTPGETAALCQSVGVSRASLYRRRRPAPPATPPRPRARSPRALGATERQAVLDVLHSARFVDQSPTEVHATLLEEQTYLCSPRTMYRVLAAAHEVRERRAQARHPEPRSVRVVQRRAPSQRPELSDARRCPLRPRRHGPGGPCPHRTRLAAYAAHPERFVQGPPRPETLPTAVWINRPPTHPSQAAPSTTTVTPNDLQPGVMGPPPRIDDRPGTLVTSVESLQ